MRAAARPARRSPPQGTAPSVVTVRAAPRQGPVPGLRRVGRTAAPVQGPAASVVTVWNGPVPGPALSLV